MIESNTQQGYSCAASRQEILRQKIVETTEVKQKTKFIWTKKEVSIKIEPAAML